MPSWLQDAIGTVLFVAAAAGYGMWHTRRHPGERVKNYFDENSWGPM